MPARVRLVLHLDEPPPPERLNVVLHGWLYRMLSIYVPHYADMAHAAKHSPFTLGYVKSEHKKLEVHINIIDDDNLALYAQSLKPETEFGYDSHLKGYIVQYHASHTPYSDVGRAALKPEINLLELKFLSCTAFSGDGKRDFAPSALKVLAGVYYKWNSYNPHAPMESTVLDALNHMELIKKDFSPCNSKVSKNQMQGIKGTAMYLLKPQNPHKQHIVQLAYFAEYAGVGVKVAFGCGQVKVLGVY